MDKKKLLEHLQARLNYGSPNGHKVLQVHVDDLKWLIELVEREMDKELTQ